MPNNLIISECPSQDPAVQQLWETVYGPSAGRSPVPPGPNSSVASNPPPDMVKGTGGTVYDKGGAWYNVMSYGAKGDAQFVIDGAMGSGSAVLTSASNKFAAADAGKLITVPKAGAKITPPAVAIVASDGGVGGTTLPTGNYTFVFTWVTGFGETTVGSSSVVYNQTVANHIITLTLPALPASAGAFKVYCTVAPGTSSTFIGLIGASGGNVFNYTTGLTAGNAGVAPGANTASTTLVTTIATFQSAGQVTLTAANASGGSVSSSFVNWGTDDTAAINACIAAAALAYGEIEIPPVPVGYMISDELTLPAQDTQIRGGGVRSLYGFTADTSQMGAVLPTIAPYFAGSVLIQTATLKDGIKSVVAGPTCNIRDVGIRFTNWFAGTGHGFNLNPPALSGKQDQGMYDSIWSGLKVFGHDGNHYAYNIVNPLYNVYTGLRGYGGGFISMTQHSGVNMNCGNETFINPYGAVIVAGTAHGINVTGETATYGINFSAWIRPQTWVCDTSFFTATADFAGLTKPTSAQFCLMTNSNVSNCSFVVPDFESNVGSLTRAPIEYESYFGPGRFTLDTATNTIQNNPASGVAYRNLFGNAVFYSISATMNPTGGAAATVLVETSNIQGANFVEVGHMTAPATGLVGQVQTMGFTIPPGWWFKITFTNATQAWSFASTRSYGAGSA